MCMCVCVCVWGGGGVLIKSINKYKIEISINII